MNNYLYLFLISILCLNYSCKNIKDITQFAPTETFLHDTLLQNIEPKRAMIIVAHDDDMCGMAGTISKLNKDGWEIAVVSFSKSPERNAAQILACRNILDTVMFVHLTPEQYRNDLKSAKNPSEPIPKNRFNDVFNKEVIVREYIKYINKFKPTVIFSLDNEMGGYGHPEHVFISQMVINLTSDKLISPTYIYQSVYTQHMENTIMKRHGERMKTWGFSGDEWQNAKKIYEVSGMPEPSVQINITSEAKLKMEYLKSYNKREREILDFFIPHFEKFSAEEYFTIFDREFFRIIKFK